MATFILLARLTPEGVRTLRSNPARIREFNREVERLGVTVHQQWATLGEFDFLSIVEAPDELAGAHVAGAWLTRQRAVPVARGDPHRRLRGRAVTTPPAPRPPDRQTPRDPSATDRRAAIFRARCALSIVHAHYWRALARAQDSQDTHARTRALAEARRLLRVAVALDQQARALDRQRDPAAARRPDRPDAPQPPNASAGGTPTPLRAA